MAVLPRRRRVRSPAAITCAFFVPRSVEGTHALYRHRSHPPVLPTYWQQLQRFSWRSRLTWSVPGWALVAIRHSARVRRPMMDAVAPEIGRATRAYLEERLPRFALRDAPGGRCETDELVASGPHDSCGRPELAGRLRRLFRVHGLRY